MMPSSAGTHRVVVMAVVQEVRARVVAAAANEASLQALVVVRGQRRTSS
jgi:hypothetical protein